ncbi:hypothetical protein ANN_03248 [Periplaneta americana]|uniref:Uncharacterized protein n=1 Tax=Periplaneta americana TaxID=6978 RepID=A0ABQ8U051_PERAM|nr:hypothetical protein ANN_03248 [Periplaneta americana]
MPRLVGDPSPGSGYRVPPLWPLATGQDWRQTRHGFIPINRNLQLDASLLADDLVLMASTEDDLQYSIHNLNMTVRVSVIDSKVANRLGAMVATVLGSVVAAVMVFVHTDRAALHAGSKEFEVLQTLWLDPNLEVGDAGAPSKSTSSKTDINPDFENSNDELFGDISDNDRPYHPEGDDEETTSKDNLESPAHSDGQKITEQVEKNQIKTAMCLWEILRNLHPAVQEATIYLDTASEQNRNHINVAMFLRAVTILPINVIIQKCMDFGHSEMECDSIYSAIEDRGDKIDIFIPDRWYTIVRTAKIQNPFYRTQRKYLCEESIQDLLREPDLRKDEPDDNADNSKSDHQSEGSEVSNHHLEPPYDPETLMMRIYLSMRKAVITNVIHKRVFENKVLRKIFGANNKRDEEWRKLHNVELHTLYSHPDIIRNIKFRRLKWAEHLAGMGESRNAYRVLVGWPEGKDVWRGRYVNGR